jgi:hypothetical protein
MAKAQAETVKVISLRLGEAEAEYLKGKLQNAMDEDADQTKYRESIWAALHEVIL